MYAIVSLLAQREELNESLYNFNMLHLEHIKYIYQQTQDPIHLCTSGNICQYYWRISEPIRQAGLFLTLHTDHIIICI